MFRVVLEGKDAEEYLNLRKRNAELAKEIMDLRAKVNGKPKSNITLVVDNDGNVKDVKEETPARKRFGIF